MKNTLTKRIIPCLDVTQGRVVKGTGFIHLKDAGDPIELAQLYGQEGADELVFLDITASSDKRAILIDLVERTANAIFIPFTVGGGVQVISDIRDLLNAGADKVSINSTALRNPELVQAGSQKFGAQCIVVAIDAKRIQTQEPHSLQADWQKPLGLDAESQWEVYSHGGRHRTGLDAVKWAQFMETMGAGEILLTSMDQDGTKAGYDLPLTQAISATTKIPVIASGGAGTVTHIAEALEVCEAALLASLLHYRELSIQEIKTHCFSKGIRVRPIG